MNNTTRKKIAIIMIVAFVTFSSAIAGLGLTEVNIRPISLINTLFEIGIKDELLDGMDILFVAVTVFVVSMHLILKADQSTGEHKSPA